jgi:hypothetical protein
MTDLTRIDGEPVPIAEAAVRLGLSIDAIRKRVQRKSLTAISSPNGQLIVLPNDFLNLEKIREVGPPPATVDSTTDALARALGLAEEVGKLRQQLAESRRDVAALERANRRLQRQVDELLGERE